MGWSDRRKPCVVAYDVVSDRRRRRLLRCLRAWRLDGQKSVHECRLTHAEAEELFLQLMALLDPATDRLLLSWVQPRRRGGARGTGRILRPARLWWG